MKTGKKLEEDEIKLFIALKIPRLISEKLLQLASPYAAGCLISNPNDMHITLRYLGETDAEQVRKRLRKIRFGKFRLPVSRLGQFEQVLYVCRTCSWNSICNS